MCWWVASLFLVVSVLLVCFWIACRISSGGARPRCVSILPQARGWGGFFTSLFFPCYPYFFSGCLSSFFFFRSYFTFFFFFVLHFVLSFGVSGLLAYVCCTRRIQYDGMALHCLLPLLHYDVVSAVVVTRACISLGSRISTDTECAGCRRVERTD